MLNYSNSKWVLFAPLTVIFTGRAVYIHTITYKSLVDLPLHSAWFCDGWFSWLRTFVTEMVEDSGLPCRVLDC